uniref:Uncharacterized protein n=1 Tax=CrAss-like virus sp. ctYsL76 TaxID=2826826 RepID=A0A8S5QLG8_9CAUD|nr:MAG TPA: hypothetical protein [CrAss-like virus sp. ctYsL76]
MQLKHLYCIEKDIKLFEIEFLRKKVSLRIIKNPPIPLMQRSMTIQMYLAKILVF